MGKDFYENSEAARSFFDNAQKILDFDLKEMCFGEHEELNLTEYTQPCMVSVCLAIVQELKKRGITPDITAGLSLGEYAAVAAAGGMNELDAIKLVRRRGILKESAFHAVSGLVLYVTIPCIIITNLNGIKIEGIMLLIVFLGFLSNVAMLGYAWFLTRKETDEKKRDFWRINMCGYSIGPLAVPYIQAFYPTTGLMTAFMFDVGNVIMSGGGTFAILAGSHEKQRSLLNVLKVIGGKMVRSGPLMTFALVVGMSALGLRFPDEVTTITKVGAQANTMLAMIMIGETIELSMNRQKLATIVKILANRWLLCILFALACAYLMPFEGEVRTAMVLICLSPVPAMSLIYTAQLGCDVGMGANLNSLSVVISIAVMSTVLLIMQSAGF